MGADPSKLHGQLAVRPKPVYPHHEGTPLPSGLDRPAWLLQFLHPPRSPLVLPPSAAAHPPDLPSPYPAYTVLPVPPFTLLTQHSYNHGTHACAHTYMRAHTRLCPAHVRPTGTLPALQPQSQILQPSPAITLPIMTFAPSSFITPPPPLRGPSPGLGSRCQQRTLLPTSQENRSPRACRGSHSLRVGMQNWMAALQGSLAASSEIKHTLTFDPASGSLVFTQRS